MMIAKWYLDIGHSWLLLRRWIDMDDELLTEATK